MTILSPTGIDSMRLNFLEASLSGGDWYEGDGHCLQQLQVHSDCHLVAECYEAPYPEMKPTYELTVMFMPLFMTDRCLNTEFGHGTNDTTW
jgi:hypothetical protein